MSRNFDTTSIELYRTSYSRTLSNYIKSTLDTVIFKSTPETVKYLTSTLDTDPPFQGPLWYCNIPKTQYCKKSGIMTKFRNFETGPYVK